MSSEINTVLAAVDSRLATFLIERAASAGIVSSETASAATSKIASTTVSPASDSTVAELTETFEKVAALKTVKTDPTGVTEDVFVTRYGRAMHALVCALWSRNDDQALIKLYNRLSEHAYRTRISEHCLPLYYAATTIAIIEGDISTAIERARVTMERTRTAATSERVAAVVYALAAASAAPAPAAAADLAAAAATVAAGPAPALMTATLLLTCLGDAAAAVSLTSDATEDVHRLVFDACVGDATNAIEARENIVAEVQKASPLLVGHLASRVVDTLNKRLGDACEDVNAAEKAMN